MKKLSLIILSLLFIDSSIVLAGEGGWKLTVQGNKSTCYSETLDLTGEPKKQNKIYQEYLNDPSKFVQVYRSVTGFFSNKFALVDDVVKVEYLRPDTMNNHGILEYKVTFKDGSVNKTTDNFPDWYICKKEGLDSSESFMESSCVPMRYMKASCIDKNKIELSDTYVNMDPYSEVKSPTNGRVAKLLVAERIGVDEIKNIVQEHLDNIPRIQEAQEKIKENNQRIKEENEIALEAEKKRKAAEEEANIKIFMEKMAKAERTIRSSKPGVIMFCESGPKALLRLGEPITKTVFFCDLTGDNVPVYVKDLISNNWQILNQIKTPVELSPGSFYYQYSLQMKKN